MFSNIIPAYINVFTKGLFPTYHYQTEHVEFEFAAMPSKARGIEMMELNFQTFKNSNPKGGGCSYSGLSNVIHLCFGTGILI